MKPRSALATVICFLVWAPFAICGFWSAGLFLEGGNHLTFAVPPLLLAVPFGVLCGLLLFRGLKDLLLVVVLSVPAYLAGHFTALSVVALAGALELAPFIPVCLGGLVGALCMTRFLGNSHPRLLSRRYLAGGAAVGCVAALPLGLWVRWIPPFPDVLLFRCSFAVWQATFGTYLYAVCTLTEEEAPVVVGWRLFHQTVREAREFLPLKRHKSNCGRPSLP
jgi:hypothetical protein